MTRDLRPDILFLGGTVRTLDPAFPKARALAIAGGRIVAVGDDEDIRSLGGPDTRVIQLEGRTCLPGLVDAHFHMYQWAMGRTRLPLDRAGSFAECMAMLEAAGKGCEPDAWVLGQGFNESDWPENRIPLRADLDLVVPDHPVLIWRCDLHLAVANTLALGRAGIHDTTPDPPGGEIGRDEHGALNGILREGAINQVKDSVPLPDQATLTRAMIDGQRELHRMGITGLGDVRLSGAGPEAALTMRAWQAMRAEGQLRLRVFTGIPGEDLDHAVALGLASGLGDEFLRIGHVKYFYDGGMGARTALMLDPYMDTGARGMRVLDPDFLEQDMRKAHAAGLAVMVHAIGDGAVREVLDVYERVLGNMPGGTGPVYSHRIEHCQVARTEDVARLARLGVPVCMQPTNMILDINMIEQCAPQLGGFAYGFRAMLDAGVRVMFSSDCPVCDPAPLVGIQAAVTRQRADGTPRGGPDGDGWHPELRISVEEAVAGYTRTPAAEYGMAGEWGTLVPGARADLIVLDRDIFAIDPLDIANTPVSMTLVQGRVVHDATCADQGERSSFR